MDKYEISAFPKDKWKGTIIPMIIRSDSYYDFEIRPFDKNGCRISMVRKPAESEIVHNPEEYDFVFDYIDKLLEPTIVWGITALGDLLLWEGNDNWTIAPDEGNRGAFMNIRFLKKEITGSDPSVYLDILINDEINLVRDYKAKPYLQVKDKLPKLEYGQCYGYVPALALGGSRSIKNLQVVDAKSYIDIIGQSVGKIYDLED